MAYYFKGVRKVFKENRIRCDNMIWQKYVDKKVYVKLKSGRNYSGIITAVDDEGNGLIFISLIDIKKHLVTFASGEIEMIQEEEER